MQKLIELFKEEQSEVAQEMMVSESPHHNLENELRRDSLMKFQQESIELEFYKSENQKLEQKLK